MKPGSSDLLTVSLPFASRVAMAFPDQRRLGACFDPRHDWRRIRLQRECEVHGETLSDYIVQLKGKAPTHSLLMFTYQKRLLSLPRVSSISVRRAFGP